MIKPTHTIEQFFNPRQITHLGNWIKDLETTKAPQGTGMLRTPMGECCLGRLCMVTDEVIELREHALPATHKHPIAAFITTRLHMLLREAGKMHEPALWNDRLTLSFKEIALQIRESVEQVTGHRFPDHPTHHTLVPWLKGLEELVKSQGWETKELRAGNSANPREGVIVAFSLEEFLRDTTTNADLIDLWRHIPVITLWLGQEGKYGSIRFNPRQALSTDWLVDADPASLRDVIYDSLEAPR